MEELLKFLPLNGCCGKFPKTLRKTTASSKIDANKDTFSNFAAQSGPSKDFTIGKRGDITDLSPKGISRGGGKKGPKH